MAQFVKVQAGKQEGGSIDILFWLTICLGVSLMVNIGYMIIEQKRTRRREMDARAKRERRQAEEKIVPWYLEEIMKKQAMLRRDRAEKQAKQRAEHKLNPLGMLGYIGTEATVEPKSGLGRKKKSKSSKNREQLLAAAKKKVKPGTPGSGGAKSVKKGIQTSNKDF